MRSHARVSRPDRFFFLMAIRVILIGFFHQGVPDRFFWVGGFLMPIRFACLPDRVGRPKMFQKNEFLYDCAASTIFRMRTVSVFSSTRQSRAFAVVEA